MEKINYLLGYNNLYIFQNKEMFNFSLDSVLLPNFVTINNKINKILDIGCGNAPIPLILSTLTKASIDGVEIQKSSYDLAIKTINYNNLSSQIRIYNEDVNDFAREKESDIYDIITCNPPYFKLNNDSKINKNEFKTLARHEKSLTLEQIMIISKKLLKNKGYLAIVHRPERLIDIICLMKKYNIEPKKIQFVYPHKNKPANILLIEGMKNGNAGVKIMDPIYSHNDDGDYTEQIKKYFERK